MAFVPRIHNRQVPVSNQPLYVRASLEHQRKHRQAIEKMKPAINNKWGGEWNGVKETKKSHYTHVATNLKRAQIEDERAQAIELENFHLLEKLSKILERPHNPTKNSREWGGGMRLDSHQVPIMDHLVPEKTTTFGAAVEAGSLNIGFRERQQTLIVKENHQLVKRIQMCKPTYDRREQMEQEKVRKRWLYNQAVANRPLEAQDPRLRRRPASAAAALTQPPRGDSRGDSRGSLRPGSASLRPGSAAAPPGGGRPARPSTAVARPKPKRAQSELDRRAQADASVLRVLDLLSAQRSRISSLRELRAQKDVLMANCFTMPSHITTELIEANGIVIHVTTSPKCKPTGNKYPEELVLLVHGGLFMSGSPQASAHLAAKLCDELGVAIATPKLRLAPEHPFPAAYEDLRAAHAYLAQYGVDPHRASAPPTRMALFAESSGGALAVAMLQSLRTEGEDLSMPCCVALSSPWLDLTCDGGSYIVNEAYDLMMRKDRLVGIATAYMGGKGETSDPRASPLLAPEGDSYRLPPTLVHVCKNELLLDDSLILGEYCKNAGTDITVKPFDQALHGWHTYFPLMPIAEQALGEMVAFLRSLSPTVVVLSLASVAAAGQCAPLGAAAVAAAVGAMAELGEQSDITSSPAFAFLEELLAAGKLTSAQAKLYQSKYSKLHEVVLKTYENEKNLLKRAKELNKDLSGERAKLEKAAAAAQEDSDTIAALRAEVGKGESELSMREERELLLQQELHDLQGVRNELQGEVTSTKKKQMAELQPRIDEIESSLAEVRGENDKHRAALTRLQQDQEQQKERALALRNAKLETESEKAQLITHLAKVRGEPEKMKKQADIAKTAADSHEGQADKSEIDIKAYEKELNEQMKRRKELEETKMQLVMEAERHRIEISARQAKADDIKKALATANEEAAHAQAERTRLEIEQKALALDGKREQDGLNRRAKEYSNALKRCKRAEVQLQTSQAQVPFMRRQLEETNRQVQTLVEEGKKQHRGIEELKREVDIFINSFLKQEGVESEKQEFLRELLDSIKLLEEELADESRYEQQQRKEVARLTAERETNAREAAKAVSSARETHEELKVKELVIIDLSKKHVETGARLREFSKLYDIVKADRNKYVNQISASAQALAEMKEKIKILQNEVEILRNESVAKDKALSKERLEHQNAFYARDALRAEQNKHMAAEKEKKAQVAQLAAETDNLNSLINGIEKEMLKLKKRYENAVEERNYTGIQLIDRNDELCILYEKSNMQQGVLKKGEVAIREREEEIRMLDLAVAEQCREIEVTRRKLPRVPELEQEIVLLQTQLEEERALAEQLSAELEAPENSKRWRKLEGKDPEPEDLAAKLQVLEERVSDKKEQLLEKDLVLEEVSNLANRLRTQALEGREDTLDLAKRVNDFQARIKGTTRRMMATVSELSMYQATAMKLTQENTFKDEQLQIMTRNLEEGMPPTKDIEREWLRYEGELDRRGADAYQKNVLQETAPSQLTHTTAEPRPNAYIPDDIGIPKPYGALAPFKPTELGATMRHIRRPNPREIEL